jgi:hypothetical protein
MMRFQPSNLRDIIVLVLVFGGLAMLIGIGATGDNLAGAQGSTSHTSRAEGTLALYRWLDTLDYQVDRLEYQSFALDQQIDMLLVFAPVEPIDAETATLVVDWVQAGGTLLLADDRPRRFGPAASLLQAFELELVQRQNPDILERAPVPQPVLSTPPVQAPLVASRAAFAQVPADAVVLLGPDAAPTMIGKQVGRGYIFVSAAVYPFTNVGLAEPENAGLVLNLLRRVPAGGRIVFDEIHHGFVREPSLRNLLFGNPIGWAVVYALAVSGLYLILGGRRFGRPVPLRDETPQRSSIEYLTSMAGLLRRGGKHDYVRDHFCETFKRRLARTYGVNPRSDDEIFVADLQRNGMPEAEAVGTVLRQLRSVSDEAGLLQVLARADALAGNTRV